MLIHTCGGGGEEGGHSTRVECLFSITRRREEGEEEEGEEEEEEKEEGRRGRRRRRRRRRFVRVLVFNRPPASPMVNSKPGMLSTTSPVSNTAVVYEMTHLAPSLGTSYPLPSITVFLVPCSSQMV